MRQGEQLRDGSTCTIIATGLCVSEVLGDKLPTRITRIGMNDVFGESGPAKELLHKYELDAEGIVNRIQSEKEL